jgi:ATP-dependent Clp protease protease subunit
MSNDIRCFEGNARPDEPFWTMQAGQPEVAFDGPISEYIWLDESTRVRMADQFRQDLYAAGGGGPVTVRVNSPGGDVFAASALRAVMLDYPGEITTRVDSVCASAATFLLTAGKRTVMLDTAAVMIHDPSVQVFLADINIETGQMIVDALKAFKDNALSAYEQRTGLSRARLSSMMTKTTYMSARDAVNLGFADEILAGGQQPARLSKQFVNSLAGEVPAMVMSLVETAPAPAPLDDNSNREAERLRDYIQVYKS